MAGNDEPPPTTPDAQAAAAADAQPAVGGTTSDAATPTDTNNPGTTPIKFACVNKASAGFTFWTDDTRNAIATQIKTLLSSCTGKGKALNPTVSWTLKQGDVSGPDIVVYFVDDSNASIIKSKYASAYVESTGGLTSIGTPEIVSEVYVNGSMPALRMANAAFHEMMHAKLNMANEMHDKNDDPNGQNKGGGDIATIPATEGDKLNPKNKALLDKNILSVVTYYKGGMPT